MALQFLEMRLDNIIFRMGKYSIIPQARQLVTLLGPPELYNPTPPPPLPQPQTIAVTAAPSDPFVDAMVANFNKANYSPPIGYTENSSATYLSSGNPCLDFFFHVAPGSPPDSIKEMLGLAWPQDPLTTLKLICNLRGVRGTGKSDKEGFYTSAFWLHDHHPKTLACNLDSFVNFGYLKDLLEILYRMLEGPTIREIQKQERSMRMFGKSSRYRAKYHKLNVNASSSMEEKRLAMAKKVLERYSADPDFRFLHDRVSDLFAGCLKVDMEFMKSNQTMKIGLAAKWCPSLYSSFDKSTLLCESIAKKVFPRENYPEYEGIKC